MSPFCATEYKVLRIAARREVGSRAAPSSSAVKIVPPSTSRSSLASMLRNSEVQNNEKAFYLPL